MVRFIFQWCKSVVPAILSTTALILSVYGPFYPCEFLQRTGTLSNGREVHQNIGLFTYEGVVDGECYNYPDDFDPDSYLKSARAFAVLSVVFGGTATFSTWLSQCVFPGMKIWSFAGTCLIFAGAFVSLTLLMRDSDICTGSLEFNDNYYTNSSCSHDAGSRCTIAGSVFYFLAGISIAFIPPPLLQEYLQLVVEETPREIEEVPTAELNEALFSSE